MHSPDDVSRRHVLKTAGLFVAGTSVVPALRSQEPAKTAAAVAASGRREIVKGLDGMSRAADGGDAFTTGHVAAGVIASALFCRDNKLDDATRQAVMALVEARLLSNPIHAPRPEDAADPKLVEGLVQDLDDGIDSLRRSGHNIIFAAVSLRALREVPEAATPLRVKGLRAMVRSFGSGKVAKTAVKDRSSFPDLGDEKKFVRFVFAEYLAALQLYLDGKGHHGFAGHILTVAHALLELKRLGHAETAQKGLDAFAQFVQQARSGADLGGRKVPDPPAGSPGPLERDYWLLQGKREAGDFVSSHLLKYPYSFHALLADLDDRELEERAMQRIQHLTAVS